MKTCTKCGVEKEFSEFYFRKDQNKYRNECKECWSTKGKAYVRNNSEKIKIYKKGYYDENKEIIAGKTKKYREENKEVIAKRKSEYNQQEHIMIKNQERYQREKEERNRVNRERYKNEPLYRLKRKITSSIKQAIKKKCRSQFLSCSTGFLKWWLKAQWTEGMSWENYGEWVVDHRTPLASAKTEEDMIKLNHPSNLQPMWYKDNQKKSAKIQ